MKQYLLKMFYAFIVPIAIGMLFSASANAQIIYTDVNPDVTINTNGGVYALDLNNDGITDFNISFTIATIAGRTNRYIMITPLGANKVGNDLSYPYPSALSLNTLIDSSSFTWLGNANQHLISRLWYVPSNPRFPPVWQYRGKWNGASNKYVPLQLNLNSQKFYGWARLDAATDAVSFTVKDYAYNSIPNQPIRAGETSCTIPTVTLAASGSLSFCAGDSVTLTANGTGYKYQWKKNGYNISGATSQTYVAKKAGVYKCRTFNSCGGKTSGEKTITVSCRLSNEGFTTQLESNYELQIAPNPLTNATSISFSVDQLEKVSLTIFDLNGRLVKTLADNVFEEGEHSIEWNAEKINAGVYFLKFQSGDFIKTERLIITK